MARATGPPIPEMPLVDNGQIFSLELIFKTKDLTPIFGLSFRGFDLQSP
jgi:hypothetical protein